MKIKRVKIKRVKAQIFSSEVIMAYFIFSFTLAIALYLWNVSTIEIQKSENFYSLEDAAIDISEKLIKTPGVPINWSTGDVKTIGLVENNESRILSEQKIHDFIIMMNDSTYYDDRSTLLGIGKYDFFFNLTDINGTTIEVQNVSAYTGSIPDDSLVGLITIRRTALLNNEIVRIILNVWLKRN